MTMTLEHRAAIRQRLENYKRGNYSGCPDDVHGAWEGFVPVGRELYANAPVDLEVLLVALEAAEEQIARWREEAKAELEQTKVDVAELSYSNGRVFVLRQCADELAKALGVYAEATPEELGERIT